jgi:RNA polymerase sigma-54 factor
LQDVVQQELEENPVLDEVMEAEDVQDSEQEMDRGNDSPADAVPEFHEVTVGEENRENLDWDSYLEGYSYSSGEQAYEDDEDRPSYENLLTRKATLFDHLMWQLSMSRCSEEERAIGAEIIGNIDDDGYFRASVAEVADACGADENLVEQLLLRIQDFDPMGVAARDLRECLLIQIRQLEMQGTLVESIVRDHLKDMEGRKYKPITRALGIEIADVLLAAKIIAGLEPRPAREFATDETHYVSPDIFVHKVGDDYVVTLNEEGLPTLRINPLYLSDARMAGLDSKAEAYVSDKTRSALWLIKSIQQRQRTIFKTAKSIVKFQREFLDKGIEHLRPLVLRDVAEDIGMHESTISRVTTNKYMQTPQGLFELKYFFNSGISTGDGDFIASESVKNKIKELVENEDSRKPYSDQKIAELLSGDNINIARRTVTKYREMLRIGSSSERKRLF